MCGITACISIHGDSSLARGRLNGHFPGATPSNHNHQPDDDLLHSSREDVNGERTENGLHLTDSKKLDEQLRASINKIKHRGPDESGTWVNQDATVGLGHCRLAILDLSPSGSQPLTSDDGEIHAVVNGEIYDHDRLRTVCATEHGYRFKGQSDSEVVLALYKIYGAPKFLDYMRGEFALVLYDGRVGREKFIAARDRYGIKPLMMTVVDDRLLLAAEAKAFLPLGWRPEWDVDSILESGWMIDERTMFKGVRKLLPGQFLDITRENGLRIEKYWDAGYPDKTLEDTRTLEEMVQGVRDRLVESIQLRMRADVPIGVYLSGGIDSSAVAGIVTKLAKEDQIQMGSETGRTRVACFSIGFPKDSGFDESSIAERTAQWLGVETIQEDLNEEKLASDFADAVYHCEHHHHDLNFVAKYRLSSLARENGVIVVLTGEGADEHLAGYPVFPAELLREPDLSRPRSPLASQHQLRQDMQQALEQDTMKVLKALGVAAWHEDDMMSELNGNGVPQTLLSAQPATMLFTQDVNKRKENGNVYRTLVNSLSKETLKRMQEKWHPLHTGMYLWNRSGFVNILLSCLGDRTEMAHGVEARTPFLDHHLTEYLNNLPPSVKMRYVPDEVMTEDDQGPLWQDANKARLLLREKWVLKEAVRPFITQELYERRKHPFMAPTRWSENGPLHKMLQNLLTEEKIQGLGFINYSTVRDNLERAFGENAEPNAFRNCLFVASWVTLAERFGIPGFGAPQH